MRQRDVAACIGITSYDIRQWERGLAIPPRSVIAALASLFGVDEDALAIAQSSFARSIAPGEGYTTAKAQYSGVELASRAPLPSRMRVLDLFCGAGGLSFGLELTARFVVVAGVDLLPDRIATFRANHPHSASITGDIRDIPVRRLKELTDNVDVIVGGPPCQGFSSIRPFRTLTEGDERNSLLEHFLLVVSLMRPRWFVLENVVGMVTHRSGYMLQTLLEGFEDCDYQVSWHILNSALYGVPQNRERLVIVGHLANGQFAWPTPSHSSDHRSMAGTQSHVVGNQPLFTGLLPKAVSVMEALGDLPPIGAGESAEHYRGSPENDFQEWARGELTKLTLHNATSHSKHMLEIIKHAGPNISSIPSHLISSGFSSSYSRIDPHKPSTTLTVNFVHPASNKCIHPYQDRALTPREGARLQSFPDYYQFCGTRAQIVKQIGNAVPPLLAKSVGDAIVEADAHIMGYRGNDRSAALPVGISPLGYERLAL